MLLETTKSLPSGGPLDINEKVSQVIVSHLEGVCAETEEGSEAAFTRRDELLAACSAAAITQLATACHAILRLCEAAIG